MAGWTITDWAPGNIQLYADEFWSAVNERNKVYWSSPPSVYIPISGADIQSGNTTPASAPGSTSGVFAWLYLQERVKYFCDNAGYRFLQSADPSDGSLWTISSFNNQDSKQPDVSWTFDNLIKAIGGHAVGTPQVKFRRVSGSSYPSNWNNWSDGAYVSGGGMIQAGDMMGPWIFQDLQKALNLLIWTDPNSLSWESGTDNERLIATGQYSGTYATCTSSCDDNADADASPDSAAAPHVFTFAREPGGGSADYDLATTRRKNNLEASSLGTTLEHISNFFIKTTAENTFSAHGCEVYEDLWRLWHTNAANSNDPDVSTQQVGTISRNDTSWPTAPVAETKGLGWSVSNQAVILDWRTENGFSFY